MFSLNQPMLKNKCNTTATHFAPDITIEELDAFCIRISEIMARHAANSEDYLESSKEERLHSIHRFTYFEAMLEDFQQHRLRLLGSQQIPQD
jgi:hypothetical protein